MLLLPLAAPLQPHRLQLRLRARHLGEAVLAVHGAAVDGVGSEQLVAPSLLFVCCSKQRPPTLTATPTSACAFKRRLARDMLTAPIVLPPVVFRDCSNGPRAGINFNDVSSWPAVRWSNSNLWQNLAYPPPLCLFPRSQGFGGNSTLYKNLLFNFCRESGDHG